MRVTVIAVRDFLASLHKIILFDDGPFVQFFSRSKRSIPFGAYPGLWIMKQWWEMLNGMLTNQSIKSPFPPSQAFCQASWAVFWYPSILLCRERHCMSKDWARSPTQTFKSQSIQAASEFYLVTLRVQKYPFIFCGQMKHCENKEIDQMKLMAAVTGTFWT